MQACGHHESPPVTLLYQAAVERSVLSWVQCGNLVMDIVAAVLVSLDAEGGRLLDAVTVTSVWKGSSGSLLMGDDPPETPSPFGPLVLDWWEEIRSCRRVEAKDGLRRIDVMEGGFTLGDIGSV